MADENGTEQPTDGDDGDLNVVPDDFSEKSGGAKSDKSQDKSQPSGAKDKGPGPWAKDLADMGLDDPRFDEFLRTKIQPHITQLEQGRGDGLWGGDQESEQAAYELLEALRGDPQGTMQQLAELLEYQQEAGDGGFDEDAFDALGDEGDDEEPDPYQSWIQQKMEEEEASQADAMYEQHLEMLSDRIPGFDPDLYTTMYLAAGNEQDAYDAYMRYHRDPEPDPESPPQLGGAEGGTPPPEEPQYSSVKDAVGAFLEEDRASRSQR